MVSRLYQTARFTLLVAGAIAVTTLPALPARLWFVTAFARQQPSLQVMSTVTGGFVNGFAGPFYTGLMVKAADERHIYIPIARFGGTAGYNDIADIDPRTYAVRYYHLPYGRPANTVEGLAVSPDGATLYASTTGLSGNALFVISTVSRTLVRTVPMRIYAIGPSMALSPDGRHLYGSNGYGLIDVDTTTFAVRVKTQAAPVLLKIASSGLIYAVFSNSPGDILALDPSRNFAVVRKFQISRTVGDLALDEALQRVYAGFEPLGGADYFAAADTATGAIVKSFAIPSTAPPLAVNPLTHTVYFCGIIPAAIQPPVYSLFLYTDIVQGGAPCVVTST